MLQNVSKLHYANAELAADKFNDHRVSEESRRDGGHNSLGFVTTVSLKSTVRFSTLFSTTSLRGVRDDHIGQVLSCASKHFAECSRQMRSTQEVCRFPFDRRKLTGNAGFRHFALPMPARQANCSHLPNVGLFRDVIFAHRKPAGDNRSSAVVTGISREVKVLCSHLCPVQRGVTTTKHRL